MEWTARDAEARIVNEIVALLLFAAFAADVAVGATKVNISTLKIHVVQLAAGKFYAW